MSIDRLKNLITGEFFGWKTLEVIWFSFCIISTLAAAIILHGNIIDIIAAITAITYTLLAGKGKISCYFFGIINTLLYGWISYEQKLFGEVMLNWGWYFPMMFTGIFYWRKNLGANQIIQKTQLGVKGKILCYLLSLIAIVGYAIVLDRLNDPQPIIDSATTILSISAMILTVKRCADQWLLWTIVNILSVWMWFRVFQLDSAKIAMLVMWLISLANGIIFYIQWHKDIKKCKTI